MFRASNSTSPLDNATLSFFQNSSASITISIIYIIVSIINLAGNGVSLWLLLFRTSPKTPSIIFMINLTLTDLALGTALPFQIAYQFQGYNWTLGPVMCRFLTIVYYCNMYCSVLSMTAIGIDRYLGIVWPMLYRHTRERKSIAVISCLFMWGVVLAVFYPFLTTDLTHEIPELGITTCFDVLKKNMFLTRAGWMTFLFTLLVILFLFPFGITSFCYISVIRKLARDPMKTAQKDKAIRLAVIVLLVFTLCFAPSQILLLAHTVTRFFYQKSLYLAYKLSLSLSCLNSCLDPFIYYFASREFRQKLRQMLSLRSLSSVDNTNTTKGERKESHSLPLHKRESKASCH